jgi:hypothetical protein
VIVLASWLAGGSHSVGAASGQTAVSEPEAETDETPAREVMMLGSSPAEAPGETWGVGEVASQQQASWVIVRYDAASGWSVAPGPLNGSGAALSGFEPDHSVIAGRITSTGSGALLGSVAGGPGEPARQVLLARDPGGAFTETKAPPPLEAEESLYSQTRSPMLAALDEGGGHSGALVVPVHKDVKGAEKTVLHWDGAHWTREPIEQVPGSGEGFRVLAIGASSPSNAWLLAQVSPGSNSVALFSRRTSGETASWHPVSLTPEHAVEPQPLTIPVAGEPKEEPFTVSGLGEPPTSKAQLLTVTSEGVWVDGERGDTPVPATMFFKPSDAESGRVLASWCVVAEGTVPCTHTLPEALPTGPNRSFAWADPANTSGFGQRVIAGLLDGVSLRLDGADFTRVISLGGWEPDPVGTTLGAAFSEPRDGWLGSAVLPVHLTPRRAPSRLTPYPVPFRHALLAIAPQPGAPTGALASQALAVGDQGEVARYLPGEGWQPESLLGAGGRRATPRLRAVAWPTPTRAYAVGEEGQMWLWRGETGLWEADPATPLNFAGDLLGIAFDPNNPSRGYAVGQAGVLLAYGKSWTQESLPPEVAGASFTSVAFAGSQAIAAYRLPHFQTQSEPAHYTSGLLVNDGSGWHVDAGATAALAGAVPWGVAGLPDGGAAISAEGFNSSALIVERQGTGAPWLPTQVPYPAGEVPSSLALFREGGALRAIGSGSAPKTLQLDTSEKPPPAGFPPNLVKPYPLGSGYIIRQTAAGWSDEQHDRNSAQEVPGEYKLFDSVYNPDPTAAVLSDPGGGSGWAIGGVVNTEQGGALETADVARYPTDGVAPPGFARSAIQNDPTQTTFAIGGNAMCAAPCADRANTGVGPDVWLSSALRAAEQVPGARAFLFTGPRVTTGAGHGQFPVPYRSEFSRYAAVLGSGALPAYAAASSTDRGPGSECLFEEAGLPAPIGRGPEHSTEPCFGEGQSAYYALPTSGPTGPVRVVMLDTSNDPGATQRSWLAGQLSTAKNRAEPVIVVGNLDINARVSAGDSEAAALAQTLAGGQACAQPSAECALASAYFYDAPEQNVEASLRVGAVTIPTFGSGTLGYVLSSAAAKQDFIGHSGFLLAQVNNAAREPTTNKAPVAAHLVPVIGELALEGKDGVLLRRSQPALFAGLARRPRAGGLSERQANRNISALYVPIPSNCIGTQCAKGIFPEYTFTSSRTDIGDFVKPNLASPDKHAVLLGPNEKPIPDPSSGLFCAYNAGTTIATISSGGMSASLAITVQAGSVRRPCGTQPLKELPAQAAGVPLPPPPAPAPAPAGSPPPGTAPLTLQPPPAPSPVIPPSPARPAVLPPVQFLPQPAPASALLPFVPLPVPTPARPTPPSGTSAVTSPVEAPEKEEEQEEAPESVSNKAVAYHSSDQQLAPAYILGMIVLAAFAGAATRRRPRRGRREVRVAPATLSAMHTQRRMSGRSRGQR